MYTVYVTDENELMVTKKKRIMQRSNLVDSFHILVGQEYINGDQVFEMKDFTCHMEYILPVSKKYRSEILTLSEEPYETESGVFMLEYLLPFDTGFTSEAGDIEIQLTFVKVDLDEEGHDFQYVRKTGTCKITILPLSAWSDIVPDEALTAIDQRIVQTQAQINELVELSGNLSATKADNMVLTNSTLQLTANGENVGNAIDLNDLGDALTEATEEGLIKVVI